MKTLYILITGASKSTGNCSSGSASGRGRAASLPNKSASGGVRASASNQSLKSVSSDGRWASNTSLNSQPVSRVAALWKKVDEAKKKQPVKDTRVWVSAEPKSKQVIKQTIVNIRFLYFSYTVDTERS